MRESCYWKRPHWEIMWLTKEMIHHTVYPKKYAHGFVVLCFVVVMQSFIMNSHEVFIHIHQGCFAGTRAIVRLPQCQWSKPDGYGKISQCITTTKHSKAKTVCIFLGIHCSKGWQDQGPFYKGLMSTKFRFCKKIPIRSLLCTCYESWAVELSLYVQDQGYISWILIYTSASAQVPDKPHLALGSMPGILHRS